MDSTSLNLATMVLGAILGGILAPIGNEVVSKIFRKNKKKIGLYSALLFLFAANGLWIMGEIGIQIFYASRDVQLSLPDIAYARPVGLLVIVGVLALASYSLWISYQHLPTDDQKDDVSYLAQRRGPLAFFIIGNILWISGEILQNLFEAISDLMEIPFYVVGYIVRLLSSFIAVILFLIAANKMRKNIPVEAK